MSTDEKAEAKVVARGELVVNVRSGKQFTMTIPIDTTTVDILDLISYLSTNLERELVNARGGSRILIPGGPLGGKT